MNNNKLPSGWVECKLDDAYCLNFGQSPSTTTYNDKGIGLPFFQGKAEFQEIYPKITKYCSIPKKTAKKNSTLLSLRAPVGPTNLAPEKCAIGRGLASIRPMCKVDYMFTLYLLRANEQKLKVGQKGTTFDAITSNQVKNLIIKFPPLSEQKRIVTKIEKLFSNLDNSDKYLVHLEKQLKRYRQSVLKSAFEGELTREWRDKQTDLESAEELLGKIKDERIEYIEQEIRKKYENKTEKWILNKVEKELDKFYNALKSIEKEEKSFNIPNQWEWVRVEEATLNLDGSRIPITKSNRKAGDIPYYGASGIIDYVKDYIFEGPHLLIAEDGANLLTRNKPIAFIATDKFWVNNHAHIIKTFCTIPLEYVSNYLNFIDLTFYITGSAQPKLNQQAMNKIIVPLCSIKEQNEILNQIEKHFSIIDKLESVVRTSIKESKRLRQSILKQAFEGKLVEQNSNDESADKLLQKIAKAKEEYKKALKRKKK